MRAKTQSSAAKIETVPVATAAAGAERLGRATALVRALLPRPRPRRRHLNLALQGGGAHGAFTWGVLDRLLDEEELEFTAIAGASAGAVNAVLVAAGLAEGGRAGAKAKLESFWNGLADIVGGMLAHHSAYGGGFASALSPSRLIDLTTRVLSPYEANPFGLNPLRELLARLVDFEKLRRSPLRLHIAATEVANGRGRLFSTAEISLDVVLASACLPHLHHAVEIDGRHYWDGGYSANPPLLALAADRRVGDTLLVQLVPARRDRLPTQAIEIIDQVNNIVFAAPLRRDVEKIAMTRTHWRGRLLPFGRSARIARHRFHLIDAMEDLRAVGPGSRLIADWRTLKELRRRGRTAADAWLARHGGAIGRNATVDLVAEVLGTE